MDVSLVIFTESKVWTIMKINISLENVSLFYWFVTCLLICISKSVLATYSRFCGSGSHILTYPHNESCINNVFIARLFFFKLTALRNILNNTLWSENEMYNNVQSCVMGYKYVIYIIWRDQLGYCKTWQLIQAVIINNNKVRKTISLESWFCCYICEICMLCCFILLGQYVGIYECCHLVCKKNPKNKSAIISLFGKKCFPCKHYVPRSFLLV